MSMPGQAQPTVRVDNDKVKVTEWSFAPGTATGYHKHQYDYIVVPLSTGILTMQAPDGEHKAQLTSGLPYFRKAGVEHDVINKNAFPFVFVEIEIK
ncbi:MAG: cupin domain-containing protein [Proteobacteria bacterium]|nr:cupin domain-containing protein [Pseudomonadota bacterium]